MEGRTFHIRTGILTTLEAPDHTYELSRLNRKLQKQVSSCTYPTMSAGLRKCTALVLEGAGQVYQCQQASHIEQDVRTVVTIKFLQQDMCPRRIQCSISNILWRYARGYTIVGCYNSSTRGYLSWSGLRIAPKYVLGYHQRCVRISPVMRKLSCNWRLMFHAVCLHVIFVGKWITEG